MATALTFRSGLPTSGVSNAGAAPQWHLRADSGVAPALLALDVDALARQVSAARPSRAERAWECAPARTLDAVLGELLLAGARTKP